MIWWEVRRIGIIFARKSRRKKQGREQHLFGIFFSLRLMGRSPRLGDDVLHLVDLAQGALVGSELEDGELAWVVP
jgi:hypothetical protein